MSDPIPKRNLLDGEAIEELVFVFSCFLPPPVVVVMGDKFR